VNAMRRPRHNGALRLQLESACRANGCSQSALTVLSTRVDPYRLDTPANHRNATWLAEQLERSFGSKNTHWRGLHLLAGDAEAAGEEAGRGGRAGRPARAPQAKADP